MIEQNPTKIVCTLGPASTDPAVLAAMIEAGMDVARLNFSHGTHEQHAAVLATLRDISARLGAHVGVLGDLQGPKIRTGCLADSGPVALEEGQEFTLTTRDVLGSATEVSTTYEFLPHDVKSGDRLLLDDGLLELQVLTTDATDVCCRVIGAGPLGEHKGINLPGVNVSAPSLTEKDKEDVIFALEAGVDYLALSFVRRPDDVISLRTFCHSRGRDIPIVAKLEKPQALVHLEEIVSVSDAVMVARGDLGVELSPEEVPVWQKRIIAECAVQGKPVITATQMLESMREHPRPTRAEASDVANAIFDGTDAVMLSAETAAGQYPVEAVAMMRRISGAAEREQARWQHSEWIQPPREQEYSVVNAVCRAAVTVASEVGAQAIIAFTESGSTARMVSKRRPRVPVAACTPLEATARRCSLYWGVLPVLISQVAGTDQIIRQTTEEVRKLGYVETGDRIVLIAGIPMGSPGSTNTLRVETVA